MGEALGYELIWEHRGVLKRFFGQVTDIDVSDAVSGIHGDERFDELRYVINDFRAGIEHSVSPRAVEEFAAMEQAAAITNPHIRIALVASAAKFVDLANQYSGSVPHDCPTRIFTTLDEARRWLAT